MTGVVLVVCVPSPKSHPYDAAVAPPRPAARNSNSSSCVRPPTMCGPTVKSKTQSAMTGLSSRTLTETVYVTVDVPSVTATFTVYLPAAANLCDGVCPVTLALLSPKSTWEPVTQEGSKPRSGAALKPTSSRFDQTLSLFANVHCDFGPP